MAARSYIRKVGTNGIYNESDEFMAGQSMWFRGPQDKIPAGWLIENGAELSRTTYATLFGVIGVTYGAGDGATTFNLPDRRGEFDRGLDMGRGVDVGRALGSKQADALKKTVVPNVLNASVGEQAAVAWQQPGSYLIGNIQVGTSAENLVRNVAGIPIIKYS